MLARKHEHMRLCINEVKTQMEIEIEIEIKFDIQTNALCCINDTQVVRQAALQKIQNTPYNAARRLEHRAPIARNPFFKIAIKTTIQRPPLRGNDAPSSEQHRQVFIEAPERGACTRAFGRWLLALFLYKCDVPQIAIYIKSRAIFLHRNAKQNLLGCSKRQTNYKRLEIFFFFHLVIIHGLTIIITIFIDINHFIPITQTRGQMTEVPRDNTWNLLACVLYLTAGRINRTDFGQRKQFLLAVHVRSFDGGHTIA